MVLLIETARELGRSLMRGIERYSRLYGPWSFHFSPGDLVQHFAGAKALHPSGIIGRIETPEVEKAIRESLLPTVAIDLYEEQKGPFGHFRNTSEIRVDSRRVGEMAADFFLKRRFENFAFVGEIHNVLWSKEREEGFRNRLEEHGFRCKSFPLPNPIQTWSQEVHTLGKWLETLPKPTALLAAMDIRGRQVISTCQMYGIRVPDEISVLGVDNDVLMCNMCTPQLSSIALDGEESGFRAAAILDGMMKGRIQQKVETFISPVRIESRESTELLTIHDSIVSDAIRFIRMNDMSSLNASDVTRHASLSRRSLEIRFRKETGKSILEIINQQRLERVQKMLLNTDMKVYEIAETCGFCTSAYLSRFFLRETGQSVTQFLKNEKENPNENR